MKMPCAECVLHTAFPTVKITFAPLRKPDRLPLFLLRLHSAPVDSALENEYNKGKSRKSRKKDEKMTRVPIVTYRNSAAAALISICGTLMAAAGLKVLIFTGSAEWLSLMLIGAPMIWLASFIRKRKQFSTWVKKVREAGFEPQIRNSAQVAFQIYNFNAKDQEVRWT